MALIRPVREAETRIITENLLQIMQIVDDDNDY